MAGLGAPERASAQTAGWGNLDGLLAAAFGQPLTAAFWLPNHPDPGAATEALGVVYSHIPGSAGSVSIHPGLFQRGATGFSLVLPISQLFGEGPRDAVFLPARVEVTLTTLRPGEARCCPTGVTRYAIDRQSGQASVLSRR